MVQLTKSQIIGKMVGKSLYSAFRSYLTYKLVKSVGGTNFVIIKISSPYVLMLIKYIINNHTRTDFSAETIFNESIDASFLAY